MGTKVELSQALVTITNIPQDTLEYGDTFAQSVSRRMSWAAKRQTTRIEDRAYCLLGIFNINMPLLYGEGEQAFQRLQEEIVRITDDQTIFAWKAEHSTFATWRGLFAHSPDEFADCADCIPVSTLSSTGSMESHSITNKGLQIKLPLSKRKGAEKWPGRADRTEFLATLRCRQTSESFSPRVTIFLKRIFGNEYVRVDADKFGDTPRKGLLDSSEPSQSPFTSDIIVRHRLDYAPWRNLHKCFRIRGMWIKNASREAIMVHVAPEPQWDDNTKRFRFPEQSMRSGELQVVTCKFEIMRHGILSHAVVDLQYDPHEEYRQICCYYKHREGKVKVEIESLVRMMDGEAFLAVGLKLMSNT